MKIGEKPDFRIKMIIRMRKLGFKMIDKAAYGHPRKQNTYQLPIIVNYRETSDSVLY